MISLKFEGRHPRSWPGVRHLEYSDSSAFFRKRATFHRGSSDILERDNAVKGLLKIEGISKVTRFHSMLFVEYGSMFPANKMMTDIDTVAKGFSHLIRPAVRRIGYCSVGKEFYNYLIICTTFLLTEKMYSMHVPVITSELYHERFERPENREDDILKAVVDGVYSLNYRLNNIWMYPYNILIEAEGDYPVSALNLGLIADAISVVDKEHTVVSKLQSPW